MMSENNGFEYDLNRISKREWREWLRGRDAVEDKDTWDAEHLYAKVIIAWPYDAPISAEGYESLGVLDALEVDEIIGQAIVDVSKKKSETSSS